MYLTCAFSNPICRHWPYAAPPRCRRHRPVRCNQPKPRSAPRSRPRRPWFPGAPAAHRPAARPACWRTVVGHRVLARFGVGCCNSTLAAGASDHFKPAVLGGVGRCARLRRTSRQTPPKMNDEFTPLARMLSCTNHREETSLAFHVTMSGRCPVCEAPSTFVAENDAEVPLAYHPQWFRASLRCTTCRTPPRERAIAQAVQQTIPDWRTLDIHESSPGGWAYSSKLRQECPGYIASHYAPDMPFGQMHSSGRWRNENLEVQTFQDESFDLVVSQDVFEHLFHPDRAIREIARTLRPGGYCIMTVPVVRFWKPSRRRASLAGADVVHHLPEEYHGNPVGDGRSLVTVDWGYDLAAYLSLHAGMPFSLLLIDDLSLGIRDPFNTVLIGRKAPLDLP